jgi:hypothetical protein
MVFMACVDIHAGHCITFVAGAWQSDPSRLES